MERSVRASREIGQAPGVEIARQELGEFGLAGAFVGEREQADHGAAGVLGGLLRQERFEARA